MNCVEAEQRLQEWLDGTSSPISPEMEAHLTECARCRELTEAARLLCDGLRQRQSPVAPHGLAERITREVLRQQQSRRRRMALAGCLVAVVAASLLLFGGMSGQRPRPQANEAIRPAPAMASAARSAPAVAGVSSLAPANQTIGQRGATNPAPLAVAFDWRSVIGPPARSFAEAGQSVAAGLEPVADSARRAVGLLLHEPGPVPASKGG